MLKPAPITAAVISEANAHKALARFGSASVRKVVAEARAKAEIGGLA